MAISPQRLTIYLYSAHRAVIFATAQLSCSFLVYSGRAAVVDNSVHECFIDLLPSSSIDLIVYVTWESGQYVTMTMSMRTFSAVEESADFC